MVTKYLIPLLLSGALYVSASNPIKELPDSIFIGNQDFHVQGIALDKQKEHIYFSFTNRLIKTDLKGNIIGSVDNFEGHLGAMTLNPEDGRIYASLECKNDGIGANIAKKMRTKAISKNNSVFYIAIFDVDKINKEGMNPQTDAIMNTICVQEAVKDYQATIVNQGKSREHRYGCSGIDGVMFAPMIGNEKRDKFYLYVGYGIYSDTTRTDNDYQILLCYDPKDLERYEKPVKWGASHTSGPKKPKRKFFLKTGNSSYGIQNMAYDASSDSCYIAVYKGKKSNYPNYSLFSFDATQIPSFSLLEGFDKSEKQWTIRLGELGNRDEKSGICGWNFPWGSTGIFPAGNNYFYISENHRDKDGKECCTARLYKWTGDSLKPFEPYATACLSD